MNHINYKHHTWTSNIKSTTYMYTCSCAHTHTHTHACTHAHTHAHTHTHIACMQTDSYLRHCERYIVGVVSEVTCPVSVSSGVSALITAYEHVLESVYREQEALAQVLTEAGRR